MKLAAMDSREVAGATASYADVAGELNLLILRGLWPSVLMGVIGLVGSTFVIARHYHDPFLFHLSWLMALLGGLRFAIVLQLKRDHGFRKRYYASSLFQRAFHTLLITYFGTFAISTVWNFHQKRAPAELLCSIGIFILCLGISGRVGADPRSAKLQGVALLLVLMVCLFDLHSDLAIAEVCCLAMFAVTYCLAVQEKYNIVVEQIRIQRKLHLLADHDVLTSLLNRRGFEFELDRLCRSGITFAILFIDLDRFKPVNDLYGHATGDALLSAVAERLVTLVRSKDVVARLGGDEFAILQLPITQRSNAEALAIRITQALSQPFTVDNLEIVIGASVGITLPDDGELLAANLLKRVDAALYRAKQQGRGQYVSAESLTAVRAPTIN